MDAAANGASATRQPTGITNRKRMTAGGTRTSVPPAPTDMLATHVRCPRAHIPILVSATQQIGKLVDAHDFTVPDREECDHLGPDGVAVGLLGIRT